MGKVVYMYKGKAVSEEELDRLVPRKADWLERPSMAANTYTEHNPLISDGCGVMKAQVAETRDLIKRHRIQGLLFWIAVRCNLPVVAHETSFFVCEGSEI